MILSEVRTTIRDILIDLGYREWDAGLDESDIPETILDDSFHVTVSGGNGSGLNMHVLELDNDVVITMWKKGYRAPIEAIDGGLETLQDLLCELLGPVIRTLPSFRKINLNSYRLEPIALDNDSVCKIIINLTVTVMVEVTQPVI